ncbi:MAG: ferritin-like domain-containing protein [Flavipsychrobacter sp.]
MNFKNILDDINNTDEGFYEKESPRRSILKSFGAKVAIAALPIAISSVFTKSYGQTKATLIDKLNRLLKLEYLQSGFYREALDNTGLIDGETKASFQRILEDNNSHVAILSAAITELGGTPITTPNIDYTGGRGNNSGPYKDSLQKYSDFLVMAQVLADSAVRAYKGEFSSFILNKKILQNVVNIHSMEARHAAYIRNLRNIPAWTTESNNYTPVAAAQSTYIDEDQKTQNGVFLVDINGFNLTENAITEAFDEPLGEADVDIILGQFVL